MDLKRKLAAIIVADVVGYSKLISENEEATLRLLETCRGIWESCAERFGGRIFNTAGDAVLLEFRSAVDAVRCAVEVQDRARAENEALPANQQMRFRIGITIGDVVERGADLLGDGVNIAARLQTLAQPGGICVSSWVQEQVANRLAVDFIDLGEQTVKNIPKPIRAFSIVRPGVGRADGVSNVRRPPFTLKNLSLANVSLPSWFRAPGNGVLVLAGVALIGVLAGLVWAGWPTSKPGAIAIETKAPAPPPPPPEAPKAFAVGETFRDCPSCPEMVVVPAGEFTMGSPVQEIGRKPDETPQHAVRIPRAFVVARASVTRDEFKEFVDSSADYRPAEMCRVVERRVERVVERGVERVVERDAWVERRDLSWRNPGFAQSGDHPAVCVNWNDANAYAAWLSRTTGKRYRLPTEAEREYFARAGTRTPFWWGSDILPGQANYDATMLYGLGGVKGDKRWGTIAAASLRANPWGLFNVHGNVSEWVDDCYRETYAGVPSDGTAWVRSDCMDRVLRGGSWGYDPGDLRSAYRESAGATRRNFNFGFRVVRVLDANGR